MDPDNKTGSKVTDTSAGKPDSTRPRDMIGISLMGSEESQAVVEFVREHLPDAVIGDHDCYYKIERQGLLEFDMARISEYLGRALTVHEFLVSMSSYYGRIDVGDGVVRIHAEILPERFRD